MEFSFPGRRTATAAYKEQFDVNFYFLREVEEVLQVVELKGSAAYNLKI
jgi:hypothetical protein